MSEILTVFGATGNQGGSVIRAVQAHPTLSKRFAIRGVTRDPSKPAGQALAASGVEVVAGNLDDPKSLAAVVKGASAVFAVTNFWETRSFDTEVSQGKAIADASLAAGVKHLVWSTIPSANKVSNGKLTHVLHFDAKATVAEYIRSLGINASFFQPAAFMSGILGNIKGSKRSADDTYKLALPFNDTDAMPMFDVADSGKWVAWMLEAGEKAYGVEVAAATDFYTGPQIVKGFNEATGEQAQFVSVPDETFESFLPKGLEKELGETFYMMRDYGYFGPPDPQGKVKKGHGMMVGEPISWVEYVKKHGV